MKFINGGFYRKLPRTCEFLANRLSDTHTLVMGEKDFTFILSICFIDFSEIRCKRSVRAVGKSRESLCIEICTSRMSISEILPLFYTFLDLDKIGSKRHQQEFIE